MASEEERLLRRIGRELRLARLRAGLTQNAAAERAGVTREYWAHVESQGRNLTLATTMRLSTAVNTTLLELVLAADNCHGPRARLAHRLLEAAADVAIRKKLTAQLHQMNPQHRTASHREES